ncbi:hypothetical protein PHYPSEUDO_006366 [Phytophthora pseudosyringae]|uniref:Chromo domain-containing protein n=1 Tax=Phytophthora pseudosyringae TaxID=221518 RepID=A0A8T1WA53_9STRA|nr:hypothetical protein PHYPSEUDO_006366 [Phytophthora pseudosyringae]
MGGFQFSSTAPRVKLPAPSWAFQSRRRCSGYSAASKPNDENASDDDEDNFIARGERFGAVVTEEATLLEDEFDLQRIWAKRRINSITLYLAQWHGFEELTWEPAQNFAPQILHEFERQYELSIWDYQSTRGRRRVLRRERPTRTSQRLRARRSVRRQLEWPTTRATSSLREHRISFLNLQLI